jgi:hypothetical protein
VWRPAADTVIRGRLRGLAHYEYGDFVLVSDRGSGPGASDEADAA